MEKHSKDMVCFWRMILLKEEPKMISVSPAINNVALCERNGRFVSVIFSRNFATPKEAREFFKQVAPQTVPVVE